MVLLIDNFDSFSHILADYFKQLKVQLEIVRNDADPLELLDREWDGLILSPGPESPQKAGNLMAILEQFVFKIPVLGICLGHQAIGEFFGGKLAQCKNPVHGKIHKVYRQSNHELLRNLPDSFEVTRYHSLEIRDVPDEIEILLKTKEGEIMAMVHKNLPVFGIQYHPEAYLTEFGIEILKNWLIYCKSNVQLI